MKSALLLSVLLLVWLVLVLSVPEPMLYVFGGEIFQDDRVLTGGALDEPSLHKQVFLTVVYGVPIVLLVSLVRWLGRHEGREFWSGFSFLSGMLLLYPFSLALTFSVHLIRYVGTAGFTRMRFSALMLIAIGCLLAVYYLTWAFGPRPEDRVEREEQVQTRLVVVVRWLARIFGGILLFFGLPYYLRYGNPLPFINPAYGPHDNAWLIAFPFILVGLALGWRREVPGGLLIVFPIVAAEIVTLRTRGEWVPQMLVPLALGLVYLWLGFWSRQRGLGFGD